ncbi:MAG: DMT family transporter [Chloroflexota bacterium]|jgi:drug/metabolite transporter (DMT)-like permease
MSSHHTDSPSDSNPPALTNVVSKSNEIKAQQWRRGLTWALLSPIFLGTVPILAKVAYAVGVDVLTVVAFRTLVAAAMLWLAVLFFKRHLIYSSTPAIISSMIAGAINGIGSLFFYASLARIDASLGQLINITYLIFVPMMLRIIGQAISLLTLFRLGLAIFAIYLLSAGGIGSPDWMGIAMMSIAALTYAIQLVLSQRILYETPATTMTLYAVTAMAIVVSVAWLLYPADLTAVSSAGWRTILLMGIVTGLSRLTLFLGVKHLGSLQTALLGVLEVIVSIALAWFLLGERLTLIQWGGAAILLVSILLVRFERGVPQFIDWWKWLWQFRLPRQ